MSRKQAKHLTKKSADKNHRFNQYVSNKCLDLSLQGLTDVDMPELVQFLLQYPSITVLDLSLNNIGDEGISYFVDRNQNVKEVNFKGNNISDNGVAVFAYKNQVIEQVNFSHNLISDPGIVKFAKINEICSYTQFSNKQIH